MTKLMSDHCNLSISADDVVNHLKRNLAYKSVLRQIAARHAIAEAARERGIEVESDAIQAETDRVRREQRLEKASDTLEWLSQQQVTPEEWEAGICDRLLSKAVAKHLFAPEVETYFANHKLNYDLLILYRIIIPYETLAQEVFYQIEEEEISFYEAAHLYDISEQRRYLCGFEGKIYRWSLSPDVAPVLWSAMAGDVVGPIEIDDNYHLFLVEEFVPAELKPEVRMAIERKLFDEWIDRELQYAFSP